AVPAGGGAADASASLGLGPRRLGREPAHARLMDDHPDALLVLDLEERAAPLDDGEDAGNLERDDRLARLDRVLGHSGAAECRSGAWIATSVASATRAAHNAPPCWNPGGCASQRRPRSSRASTPGTRSIRRSRASGSGRPTRGFAGSIG